MIKRILDISEGPCFLCIENDQLVLSRDRVEIGRVPCEDIGVLLVDQRGVTYTHAALVRLISHGACVVLCGENHLPAGLLLPMADNELLTQRLRVQAAAPLPLRKRLWRQVVRAKIRGQAMNLPEGDPMRGQLLSLADEIKSGDSANVEGLAARFYWQAMGRLHFGPEFRRDPDGLPPNGLLNYGYMVMRAALARAIAAAGLHPAFGLHHSNRNNPFCLADDLVEVLRPAVDAAVVGLIGKESLFVDRPAKAAILSILSAPATVAEFEGPLMVGLHRVAASLVRCYEGTQKRLDLPVMAGKDAPKAANSGQIDEEPEEMP